MSDRKIIALDLDGTIATYDGFKGVDHFGPPFTGAVEFTKRLGELGEVWIHTCRVNPEVAQESLPGGLDHRGAQVWLRDKVERYLQEHGFHYDQVYVGPGKPHADIYIDDKGLECRPKVFNREDSKETYYGMIAKQAEIRLA